ncbi:hypothetical protein [Sutcliffiella rhizosphaerae]|uniref:Aminoglycoside phosphotransferase domain-containing protein n=1 Tax=Sutcliffiella rhizosphaerae TaxID=2880967 RepID=A0ABM8YNB8_9BACI|nr:hypothetical protein [Sutcliffiella rhizosphaerae]CAG9621296.1 hypothetical protein BACCIP111883_02068 [Sutcliffiella rhizosphaerae]
MKHLNDKTLESFLKSRIINREIIDDTKQERIIEKITTKHGDVFIKYGQDIAIRKEIEIYETYFSSPETLYVPRLLTSRYWDNSYFLALEWLDGIHPDFQNSSHVEKVFSGLGKWAANWNRRITEKPPQHYTNFEELQDLLESYTHVLEEMIGQSLALLKDCLSRIEDIIKVMESTPLTLDPGDISLLNIFMNEDEITFIDFESCKIGTMTSLVEHLGEKYQSIPHHSVHIQIALKSYLHAWNTTSNIHLNWHDFYYSQLCVRLYYKLGIYVYWIERIIRKNNIKATIEWINQDRDNLAALLENLDKKRVS